MLNRQRLKRIGTSVWSGWPEKAYRKERYRQRLAAVQSHFACALDQVPGDRATVLSMCAGDGRDVIEVLAAHPRRNDTSAWLVELNPKSVALGMQHASSARLESAVTFLNADATDYAIYRSIAPADIVLACGVWGHVPAAERSQLVRAFASLCTPGGCVIGTRGLAKGAGRLADILSLFSSDWWEQVNLTFTPDQQFAVVTHRYRGPVNRLPASGRIFNFARNAGR